MDERTPGGAADPTRQRAAGAQAPTTEAILQQQEEGRAEEGRLLDEAAAAMGQATQRIQSLEGERNALAVGAQSGAHARTERMSRVRSALEDLKKALRAPVASILVCAAIFAGGLLFGGATGLFTSGLAA